MKLRALVVEDRPDDAELLALKLRGAGFDLHWRRVETETELSKALHTEAWDIVLSDYGLPAFSGPAALQVVRREAPEIPFIIVSGSVGEELAVLSLKAGASDFFLKGKLDRLPNAVEREVREARLRREGQEATVRLRESEERLRVLFEQVIVGIARSDAEGRIIFVNDRFCEIVWRSREELLQMKLQDLTHPADLARNTEYFTRTIEEGTSYTLEKRYLRPDATHVWVRNCVSVLRGASGESIGTVAVVQDISGERRAAEALAESEVRFRSMADSAPVMLWVTDEAGAATYLNRQWYEFTGQTEMTGLGRGWLRAVHPDDADIAGDIFADADRRREPFRLEYRIRRADGEYRWAINSALPRTTITGEGMGGFIGSVIDITERKQSEEALREALQARDEFLSIASHELRTPLTSLQLQVHTLSKRMTEYTREGKEEWLIKRLATIQRQSGRLERLVDELLDIARIVGGRLQLELEPVELGGVVREVVAELEERSRQETHPPEIILKVQDGISGRWDRMRLEQVVNNLLSNALKYGAGKPITLGVVEREGVALLTVEDRGIGIDPHHQDRIFGRFERAVSTRHYGGLGLGLFVVRQVVEAMGGTIGVVSAPDQGATFTVRLPLAGPAMIGPPSNESRFSGSNPAASASASVQASNNNQNNQPVT
jgi:PAS domain S-box-containing protein